MRYKMIVVAWLHHYTSDHQKDNEEFVQPLTYEYNTQVNRSTRTAPLSIVASKHSPSLSTVVPRKRLSSDTHWTILPCALRIHLFAGKQTLEKDVNKTMLTAQILYKRVLNENVRVLMKFKVDKFVYVSKPPCLATLSKADKVTNVSYNEVIPRAPGPL